MFLKASNAMSGETFEEGRDAMFFHVTWESENSQYILYDFNVLITSDLWARQFLREDFDAIFVKKSATIIAYNDAVCYGTQSLKLNDYNTTRLYFTTVIQMLIKASKAWLKLKCLFKINKSTDD
jgi:hypothetical protein